jgi:hypothetical protein
VSTQNITPTIANQVLWHSGNGGYEPGSFVNKLIGTIANADDLNRGLLGLGFPGYVQAVNLIERSRDGVDYLKEIDARPEPGIVGTILPVRVGQGGVNEIYGHRLEAAEDVCEAVADLFNAGPLTRPDKSDAVMTAYDAWTRAAGVGDG